MYTHTHTHTHTHSHTRVHTHTHTHTQHYDTSFTCPVAHETQPGALVEPLMTTDLINAHPHIPEWSG